MGRQLRSRFGRTAPTKERGTNFVKLFPGLVFPWIDGFGFNYDHVVGLKLTVKDVQDGNRLCDAFKASGELQ